MILHFLFFLLTFYTLIPTATDIYFFFEGKKQGIKSPSPPARLLDWISVSDYWYISTSFMTIVLFLFRFVEPGFPIGWEFGGAYPPPELSRCGCILRFCADPVLTVSMFFTGGCLLCMNWRSTGPPVKRNSCTKTASSFFSASNGIKRGSF